MLWGDFSVFVIYLIHVSHYALSMFSCAYGKAQFLTYL